MGIALLKAYNQARKRILNLRGSLSEACSDGQAAEAWVKRFSQELVRHNIA